MIPEAMKINVFTYTRIPRPSQLFLRTGFTKVSDANLYDSEGDAVSGRKLDILAEGMSRMEQAMAEGQNSED